MKKLNWFFCQFNFFSYLCITKQIRRLRIMLVTNIEWETDGEVAELPTEVEVEDGMSDDEIADHLSDEYGWLVNGFSLPMDNEDRDYFGEYVNKVEARVS